MKKLIAFSVVSALLITSCAETYRPSQTTYEGGLIGAVTGATAGAILTHDNKWKGGVIGGVLGAIAGATIAEISKRGAVEAVQSGRPVQYTSEDGRVVYRAEPIDNNQRTECKKVKETIIENGKVVKEQIKEVCESTKVENKY
ncbi:glycine zipper 2TM domain-containing protein [Venenivibrio stagnispumantis]|uniref:Glycine zipper 2TM domain-containing protein n=1 Tax=Venenivibrio stagnispumantis TaxID=407998 RepID=A0AA46AFG0_9AQUI|nr:YMGG-like glycine zipper-containing protein [Venenivibrio stagnispumantis]MCW4573390.1 glycine zipper 2TM domain-containing protein [Venenivibrio stagnispumantis]SMP20709.1 Glycine zipper 2TM domain-containing protein [Venenivibrio stagnispumantis]